MRYKNAKIIGNNEYGKGNMNDIAKLMPKETPIHHNCIKIRFFKLIECMSRLIALLLGWEIISDSLCNT
jgi:hypothetical protein